jgi:P-type Cu+ transporter
MTTQAIPIPQPLQTIEVPIRGMDCNECVKHVTQAIAALPGVDQVDVFLTSEKASIRLDPSQVPIEKIRQAVVDVGYSIPAEMQSAPESASTQPDLASDFSRQVGRLLALVFGAVLFIVLVGEGLGLFERITALVPFPIGAAFVLISGFPIFRNVIRAARRRQVVAHTMMSVGVFAALLVGEWATAAVVVFLMRVGSYVESFTADRARRAVKNLTVLSPQTARIERNSGEIELPITQVRIDDVVIVRPGEKIPVDGIVTDGHATIDQATITGESMPVEAQTGTRVYAATVAQLGYLRVRATRVGADTTFGRVIKMVEDAEAHRAEVQTLADKFSGYYLPVVAVIAALTLLISRNPLSMAAVLVVACSCSFALATPIAMLASIGAAARRGLLIKGGKYIELLARADVLLVDKTGTLTLGKPQLTDIAPQGSITENELIQLAASVERFSEHPLAGAIRSAAESRSIDMLPVHNFEAIPGMGVQGRIGGALIQVGNRRFVSLTDDADGNETTSLYVARDGVLIGTLAASDTLRPEIPEAFDKLRALGINRIELLTGDNEHAARGLATQIGIEYRAGLLPEDKIRIVKEYQAQGRIVVMVGDGVNDAPALAQANIGIAMGAAGTDVAIEAAHITLLRDDWLLVPEMFRIAQRTMRIVRMNLGFTVIYNVIGLTLAATGILPPILAAAAQSIPDLGILGNSSRLLRQGRPQRPPASE